MILSLALSTALTTTALDTAIASFERVRPMLVRRLGKDQAIDLGTRLVDDRAALASPPSPAFDERSWEETLDRTARLDLEAVRAVATDSAPQLPTHSGLHEGFVRSPTDGVWEPVAVYIPARHAEHPPLAIVLHGRPQSETELLSQPYLRALADRSGTILVAPWGRGDYDFSGVAQTDLDALVPVVQTLYASDPRRLYLVGYSMGGFSVFKVGTKRTWAAVMCIAGALLNSEVAAVRFSWRDTPVYIVNGSDDASIPPIYGMESAVFLSGLGVPTSFYQQPGGEHYLRTLVPALTRAWDDMQSGIVRADSIPRGTRIAGFLPVVPSLHDSATRP